MDCMGNPNTQPNMEVESHEGVYPPTAAAGQGQFTFKGSRILKPESKESPAKE